MNRRTFGSQTTKQAPKPPSKPPNLQASPQTPASSLQASKLAPASKLIDCACVGQVVFGALRGGLCGAARTPNPQQKLYHSKITET